MRGHLFAWTLSACGAPPPYTVPAGAATSGFSFDGPVMVFPDDLHTVPDPASPTGARVVLSDAAWAEVGDLVPESFTLREALEALDGFGTTAGVMFRFDEPLDPASVTAESLRWVRLDDGAPVAWSAEWTDEGATLIVTPLMPLGERTAYGVVATGLRAADGGDVAPAPDHVALLHGGAPPQVQARLGPSWVMLLTHTGVDAEDVDVGTVFGTQSVQSDDALVVPRLQAGPWSLVACVDEGWARACEGRVEVADPLGPDAHLGTSDDDARYTIQVTIWLPPGSGPAPLQLYAHGLGGDRGEGRGVAERVVDLGLAVAAIDAPAHGDHPAGAGTELTSIFEFFGITLSPVGFDVLRLRDTWRRAAWDQLQVIEALRASPDVDGDGAADLDARVVFGGHSLGATMGPHLVALDGGILAAELATPGGRVTEIVHRGQDFSALVALFAPDDASTGDVDRFFPFLQAAIERGEPLNHAAQARASGAHVLVTQVLDDTIIPNACTEALARALAVDLAPPVLREVEGLPVGAPLPASGNQEGTTALAFQYDVMVDDGVTVDATHTHIHGSESAVEQYRHYWSTWLAGGVPELIDPFAE